MAGTCDVNDSRYSGTSKLVLELVLGLIGFVSIVFWVEAECIRPQSP